jgi:xanthine dehydrogenase YagR molybdenum-binding subunit
MKATPFAIAVAADILVRDGRLAMARRHLHIPYVELLACNGLSTPVGEGDYDLVEGKRTEGGLQLLRGFAKVRVDPDLGLVRLNRPIGVYDTGRIINPKTARSQAIGGTVSGVWQALLEQSETDPVMGRFLKRSYSATSYRRMRTSRS